MAKQKVKSAPAANRASVDSNNFLSDLEFGNKAKSMLDIPAECQKELDAMGYEGRWVDIVQLKKNHGYHKREWTPVKFKCLGSMANPFGSAEGQYEGYLIRQQLVLAGKLVEKAQARRKYVRARTLMQSNPTEKAVEEFKTFVSEKGANAKVLEWDENKDNKD